MMYTFLSVQKRTYIFAPSMERARWFCRRMGIQPYSRNTVIVSQADSIRGCRIHPWDEIFVLEDFWGEDNAIEIHMSTAPAMIELGKTLWDIPVTYSVDVP